MKKVLTVLIWRKTCKELLLLLASHGIGIGASYMIAEETQIGNSIFNFNSCIDLSLIIFTLVSGPFGPGRHISHGSKLTFLPDT